MRQRSRRDHEILLAIRHSAKGLAPSHFAGAGIEVFASDMTALAALRRDIPAVHYMIAAFGGPVVRCTDYAPYGTAGDLGKALWRAVELEQLARVYYLASLAGAPVILPDDEIMRTVERFRNYGPKEG